jgi:hypothetical protein
MDITLGACDIENRAQLFRYFKLLLIAFCRHPVLLSPSPTTVTIEVTRTSRKQCMSNEKANNIS